MGFPLYIWWYRIYGRKQPKSNVFHPIFRGLFLHLTPERSCLLLELVENRKEGSNSTNVVAFEKAFGLKRLRGWFGLILAELVAASKVPSFLWRIAACGWSRQSIRDWWCKLIWLWYDLWHLTLLLRHLVCTTLAAVQLMSSFIFSFFFFQASTYPQPFHLGCFINIKVRNGDTKRANKIQSTMMPPLLLNSLRVFAILSCHTLGFAWLVPVVYQLGVCCLYSFLTSIEPNSI